MTDNCDGMPDAIEENVMEKWHNLIYGIDDHPGVRSLPEWVVKVMVVDSWKDVLHVVKRRLVGENNTLIGDVPQPSSVPWTTIWNDILSNRGNPPFPTVSALEHLSMSRTELAEALHDAGAWGFIYLRGLQNANVQEIVEKWRHVHDENVPQATSDLPLWILRVLLVDCWNDVWQIVQMSEAGLIDMRR